MAANADEPSDYGREQWPPTGLYDGVPCTCESPCGYVCTGQPGICKSKTGAGCAACMQAYADNLSADYE